jgi:RND family efflux transporter MFP subunit
MNLRIALRMAIGALAVASAALLTSGCGQGAANQLAPPPPTVTVAPVEQRQIVEWEEFTGRTEPVDSVEVRPRVSGYLQEIKFQSGQLVKKGDVLFVIDPRWHQSIFDQRNAELQEAEVKLKNAQREAARTDQLLANKAISTEEGDTRDSGYQEARAEELAARAALDSARLDLDYTQVRAPIDGRVSRALWTEGNYVSGVAGANTVLTTIVSVDPVYVYADVDENSLLKFNALAQANRLETNGDGHIPVDLQLADEDGYPHTGYIESWDNQLDSNTGSILLRAVFPNPDGRVMPGLFARIRVPLSDRHPALLIEERAIGTDQAQKFVLGLTSSNTVEYLPVELGGIVDGRRVVHSGLQAGRQIVVNGLQRARPGMPVTPQQETASTDTPAAQTAGR